MKHKRLGSNVVSTIISDKVQANPLVKTRDIMDYLKQDYGFEVAYHTMYRGKDVANQSLHGNEGIGYGYLPWYLEAVKRTNPGSRCVLDTQDCHFCHLFIAYGASLHGFQYCPPILFVDGTFIKNKYKGMLLGLLHDIKEVFPSSPHSYCVKHLKDNLFGKLSKKLPASNRDTLVSSFAACAYARTQEKFDEAMQKLRSDGKGVVEDFMKELKSENYAFAHFPGKRYGVMSNSQAEKL
ncbi:hypothetical protein ACLB2K_063375 [Fragaria x ananassa]